MATAARKLATAIEEFHREIGGDPSYRHVSGGLRTVQSELSRLPAGLMSGQDPSEEPDRKDERSEGPKTFRDARKRARDEFADDGERKDDRASASNSPEGGDEDDAAREEDS